jgi:serine phosphatase RsbU (regulator of sigma subunit)
MRLLFGVVLFVFSLLPGICFSQTGVLVLKDSVTEFYVSQYAEILPDRDNSLGIEDIVASFSDKFVPISSAGDYKSSDIKAYWLRLRIANKFPRKLEQLLEVDGIDYVTLYLPQEKADFMRKQGGTLYGLHEREVFIGRVPHIPFSVEAGEETMIYLHLQFETPFNLQNKAYLNTIENIRIKNAPTSIAVYQQTRYYQGFYIGAVIVIALYNLFLFLFVREKSYLFYVLFVVTSGLSNFVLEGFALEFFWDKTPSFDRPVYYNLFSLSWFFFIQFTIEFLNLKTKSKRWADALRGLAYIQLLFVIITSVFGYWNLYIQISLSILTIVLILALNVWFVFRGYRPAKYFLLANVFFLAGQTVLILIIWDILPENPLVLHAEEIGEILQALLFSVALADKINLMQSELNKKIQEQADMRRKQEEERQKAVEDQKRALEMEVKRRTAEITAINNELLEQKEEILQQRDYIESKNIELEKQAYEIMQSKEDLNKAFNDIMLLSDIGKMITASLDAPKIIATVYDNIKLIMDVTAFMVGLYDPKEGVLHFEEFLLNGEKREPILIGLDEDDRISIWCLKNRKTVFSNDITNDFTKFMKSLRQGVLENRNSVIFVPLETEHKLIGVLSVQSEAKNAYKDRDVKILETLAAYMAIALDNSGAYADLEEAHTEIERKNIILTDSLRYAQDIQEVILPTSEKLSNRFSEHFEIYMPKDYVSGDFYWEKELDSKTYLAVADCTGHGVPGAFMSIIGTSLLNEIIGDLKKYDELGVALEDLHLAVQKALKQDVENSPTNDGMDIALCLIEPLSDGKSKLSFSGAKRPIYYTVGDKLLEVKGTRRSIGGRLKKRSELATFVTETVILEKNSVLYMFTDGFPDQPNPSKQKLGSHNLKSFVEKIMHLPLKDQERELLNLLISHMDGEAQRDDITFLAVKV